MFAVDSTTAAVETTTAAPPSPTSDTERFQQLLAAAKRAVRCDAVALLQLEAGVLTPVAVDGLSLETLGRRFAVAAHPRLARLVESASVLRFPADCPLPDPYDGLVLGQANLLAVHDCMGAPLHVGGRLWGLLTFDTLAAGTLAAVATSQVEAVVRLIESGLEAVETLRAVRAQAAREQAAARAWQSAHAPARELLGTSPAMQRLRAEIDTVAASDLTVLVLGETGVGKDLVSQRLHAASLRRDRPLVQVNCAALPESLADSELFGHRKGAFTGAVQDRVGKFELADGGTLFLDEVGELPLAVQAKLLRVLQSGEVQRPGSDRLVQVNVRVVAATNRDLGEAIRQGRFRADLYHRLAVYPLVVPPLRERGRDVLTLAGGFLEENQHRLGARNLRLAPEAKAALLAHAWPGNVRELEHVLSRAALRAVAEPRRPARWVSIELRHIALEGAPPQALPAPSPLAARRPEPAPDPMPNLPAGPGQTLRAATEDFQRRWIQASLARHAGQPSRAAAEAGMDRSNFHRLLRRLGLATTPPAG
ncbi:MULTISPECIES: nitric oxide reductase transcriptional regulator NorR [Ramlibacter]|uniref:Nitric oxide reductase transcriptional regulator NorR n=1 Tax=Ramlibacter pinisoli TaxID=2682844 RepID=A0A6N8IUK4_9BURK|nr:MULTISPECIES: nitric oxide reductase transcriptional regulator NorR [Ramlibacter]MBA2965561.1 nitric oxide reductase transcriptional regulator NorR [Ramlibacter sp. CGMCC 1.13660]MVQ30527.1 nitric oxide reductase transcriptional regulator NorR [Ramlibacter pinisoli]